MAGTETKMADDEHMADPGVARDVHDDDDGRGNGNGTGVSIGADGTSTAATPIDSADRTAHDKERTMSPSLENRLRTGPATPAHTHYLASASTGTGFGITYHGIRRPVKTMC